MWSDGKNAAFFFALTFTPEIKRLGIWMPRVGVKNAVRSHLNNPAQIHDGNAVADVLDQVGHGQGLDVALFTVEKPLFLVR
jgi:hypothetical protein